jgi:hypothetical protein
VKADEFLPYASILTSVRESEIALLGTYYRHWISDAARAQGEPDERARQACILSGKELIPSLYADLDELAAAEGALVCAPTRRDRDNSRRG